MKTRSTQPSGYFGTLNYTLANEDTSVELDALPFDAGHVMSVAGSGGRILPLLAKRPKVLTCVDVAQEQLFFTELRLAAARQLELEEYLGFMGFAPSPCAPPERRALFATLDLSPDAKRYLEWLFEKHGWASLLYEGRWERTMAKLSRINQRITGPAGARLFEAKTLGEQEDYLANHFPRRRWNVVLAILGNSSVFNALLYKGSFPRKNLPQGSFSFYRDATDRIFHRGVVRENFFAQVLFFGRVMYAEGNPIECSPTVFSDAKQALASTIVRYVLGDIVTEAARAEPPVDFLSLSDVPSYFSGAREVGFLSELRTGLAPRAIVVQRSYLHVPFGTNLSGYEVITDDYRKSIEQEKVQVYSIDIYRKANHEAS